MHAETEVGTGRRSSTTAAARGDKSATRGKIAARQGLIALQRWESEGGAVHDVR